MIRSISKEVYGKYKNKFKFCFLLILTLGFCTPLHAKDSKEQNSNSHLSLQKSGSLFDRSTGFLNAGKMKIYGIENFGLLCGWDHPGYQRWYPGAFHGDWGEVRWIAPVLVMPPGPWGAQSTNGPSMPDDRSNQYNAIESFSAIHSLTGDGASFTDWEALDGSAEHYQGKMLQDNIPMVATSTFPTSWPEGYFLENEQWKSTPGEYHWPGGWALDPDESSPTYGQPMEGEFVSNQDIFFISSDKYNGIRLGATTAKYGFPVGIDMEVSAYSYSTTIYENVTFFNINYIYRTADDISNPDSRFYDPNRHYYDGVIDSVYFAFFVDPDLPGRYLAPGSNFYQASPWAEDDYGLIYDYDGDGKIDVFLAFDKSDAFTDENYSQNTGPVSAYGVNFFKTPLENPTDSNSPLIGITGFHWFDQDEAMRPTNVDAQLEKTFFALSAGRPDLIPEEDRDKWFHGLDPHQDNIEQLKDYQESFGTGNRPDIQFWFSSGPFSIAPGDTIPIHIGIVGNTPDAGGLDAEGFALNPPEQRFESVFTALRQADSLYQNNFIGFRPPSAPKLNAVGTQELDKYGLPVIYGENEQVTLYWDDKSEDSFEIISRDYDFQGYRIYRTQANVEGQVDPDWGTPIYDYSGQRILGYRPMAQFDLVDEWEGPDPLNPFFDLGSNTGLKYQFVDNDVINSVRYRYTITAYDHPIVDDGQPALESSRGNDPRLIQTVDVIPGLQPQGFTSGKPDSSVSHISGLATGYVITEIINPIDVTGHSYEITFKDSSDNLRFDLVDLDSNKILYTDYTKIWLEADYAKAQPRPIFDGIGLKIINHNKLEQQNKGWLQINGTKESTYRFGNLTKTDDNIYAPFDYQIVFGDSTLKYYGLLSAKKVPFQVFNVTKDSIRKNPLRLYVRNPGFEWQSGDFIYFLEADEHHKSWQISVEWNSGDSPPQAGDIYEYHTKKPFKEGDVYRFGTKVSEVNRAELDLKKIKVVPNPYMVSSLTEQATTSPDRYSHELRFTHLPQECTIKIYTLRGDLVKTIRHHSNSIGEARWNLQSEENLEVSYGVYIYTVSTPNGKKKVDKFAIIW
jgi:hypothetical protein